MKDLSELKPADYNPRTISKSDYAALRKSISELGDMSGLVFNSRTGNIVGGHQRREAYSELGGHIEIIEELDKPNSVGTIARGFVTIGDEKYTYRVVDWDEKQEKLANLAANKIQGEWDDDKLAELIYSLKDEPDILDSGFSVNEVTEILATVMETNEDDADLSLPAEGKAKSKLGDLYQLGEHRLLCGDATVRGAIDALMDGKMAGMVFTDPPYNVDYTGGMGGDGKQHGRRKILNDKMSNENFYEFLSSVCKNLMAVCEGGFYICMSSSELHNLHRAFSEAGGHWQTYVIWAKHAFTLSRSDYQHQFEPILYGLSEEQAKLADENPDNAYDALPIMYGWNKHHNWYGGRKQGDVWLIDRPTKSPNHPTEKPVSLCAKAIRNSSKRDDIVLGVFGGSGSTLVAAQQLQRRCYMMEMDPRYVDVIIRRWQHITGKKAVLIRNLSDEPVDK
jgi:DNA modification methylase